MPKVQFYKKYGAVTSKIAKAGLMPRGLHGFWCMGMPPTRLKAFRTTVGRCLPGKHAGRSLTWRLAMHQCDPTHPCRGEPIPAWAEAVWDEQLDDANRSVGRGGVGRAAGRCQSQRGQRRCGTSSWTTPIAAWAWRRLVGLKLSWSKVSFSHGRYHHVPEAAGLDMATPHDLRHCKWARGGLETDLPQGRESAGDRGESGRTTTNGRSCSRAPCWNL